LVSLIIPVYGRFDFIEYQLSLFADDPSMHNCEIIYVLDDPRLGPAVATTAATLESVYRIAWSIVYLPQNLGFAGANNSAVQYAHAPHLLLMNSDVIPFEAGWLDALLTSAANHLSDSVIGVQLLYEDRTVQHNGMRFESSEAHDGLWINIHPGKGIPVSLLPDQDMLESCEAVSGACLLVSRENFQLLQGFDDSYIIGDFEDSDLCLRARASGLSIRICRATSMCHLERLSQSMVTENRWKTELTYYNCWLHSSRWDRHIRQLVAREANA
jgi:GT2 family glycosyltransferase